MFFPCVLVTKRVFDNFGSLSHNETRVAVNPAPTNIEIRARLKVDFASSY